MPTPDSAQATADEMDVLLARSAKLRLFVALFRIDDPACLQANVVAHAHWLMAQETQGRVFLAGPLSPQPGTLPVDGIAIIRADTQEDARAIVAQDPLVTSGAMRFEIREWTILAGKLSLDITLSDTTIALR